MQVQSTNSMSSLKFLLSWTHNLSVFICMLVEVYRWHWGLKKNHVKIKQNPDITLQVAVEHQQLMNFRYDSHMVHQSVPATTITVNTIQNNKTQRQQAQHIKSLFAGGGWHFTHKCPFKITAGVSAKSKNIKKDSTPHWSTK